SAGPPLLQWSRKAFFFKFLGRLKRALDGLEAAALRRRKAPGTPRGPSGNCAALHRLAKEDNPVNVGGEFMRFESGICNGSVCLTLASAIVYLNMSCPNFRFAASIRIGSRGCTHGVDLR